MKQKYVCLEQRRHEEDFVVELSYQQLVLIYYFHVYTAGSTGNNDTLVCI
jgi:hypothetical protein